MIVVFVIILEEVTPVHAVVFIIQVFVDATFFAQSIVRLLKFSSSPGHPLLLELVKSVDLAADLERVSSGGTVVHHVLNAAEDLLTLSVHGIRGARAEHQGDCEKKVPHSYMIPGNVAEGKGVEPLGLFRDRQLSRLLWKTDIHVPSKLGTLGWSRTSLPALGKPGPILRRGLILVLPVGFEPTLSGFSDLRLLPVGL